MKWQISRKTFTEWSIFGRQNAFFNEFSQKTVSIHEFYLNNGKFQKKRLRFTRLKEVEEDDWKWRRERIEQLREVIARLRRAAGFTRPLPTIS
jgi:hypothetical protein